jgi:hypothetical protein
MGLENDSILSLALFIEHDCIFIELVQELLNEFKLRPFGYYWMELDWVENL